MILFSHQLVVPKEDTANFADHVHHAKIIEYLERARLAHLGSLGLSYQSFVDRGLVLVISKIEIEYKREVRAEELRISVENVKIEGKILRLEQTVTNSRGKEAVRAKIDQVFVSIQSKRAIEVPEDIKSWLSSK